MVDWFMFRFTRFLTWTFKNPRIVRAFFLGLVTGIMLTVGC